ncbi:Putative MO25-like protein At5g47540 [Linum perenne]
MIGRGGGGGTRTTSYRGSSVTTTAAAAATECTAVVGCVTMKGLFKHKNRSPVELVQYARDLVLFVDRNSSDVSRKKREDKMADLGKVLVEMRTILFGEGQAEPNADACSQLTQEFFREDTLRILIRCLPKLGLGPRQIAASVITNLQKQRVHGRLVAPEYMESNLDLMDVLLPGYEDAEIALTYGSISRDLICHQVVAKHVLESAHMTKFFTYVQLPNFEIASVAQATFKELLTRHKSTVAEFLVSSYDWFFQEYNSQLLESKEYITRRYAVKLLGDMLLDRSNSAVMVRYVSSLDNMRILMNLFRVSLISRLILIRTLLSYRAICSQEEKKSIQMETFHVFKLFVANQSKPPEIISVLVKNKIKLLRFLASLKTEKEDVQFEEDKSQVIKEIATLETADRPAAELDNEAEAES